MKKLTIALLVLCTAGLLTGCDTKTLDQAKELIEEEKYEEAVEVLETMKSSAKSEKQISICYYKMGEIAKEGKDWWTAQSCFSKSKEDDAEEKAEECLRISFIQIEFLGQLTNVLRDRVEGYQKGETRYETFTKEMESIEKFTTVDFTESSERLQELFDEYYEGLQKQNNSFLKIKGDRVNVDSEICWREGEIEKYEAILKMQEELELDLLYDVSKEEYTQENLEKMKSYLEDLVTLALDARPQFKISEIKEFYGLTYVSYTNNTHINCNVVMYIQFFDSNFEEIEELKQVEKDGILAGDTELLGFYIPSGTEYLEMRFYIEPTNN